MSFASIEQSEANRWHPRIIVLGEDNKVINERGL
jgi:aspartate 1-decarboxylase